ncbi:MAG: sodium ion-translocating decarboxylase subunit beta [bacterium]|nr:sodium ion-translocating decarboxylase subunit beta [bacterium]
MFVQSPQIVICRIVLIFAGFLLVYLGVKGTLEPLIMVPMGLGMSAVNAGVLFMENNQVGNLIIDPLLTSTDDLMKYMQINFLQPIYTLTFSNGLIACLVFMGIGILCDLGYVLEHPFISMTLALFAEAGTILTYPVAKLMGLSDGASAAVSIIGGADGPMVLFASLKLAPEYFVPISIVAYLYLSLTYGGYPYLIKLFIPKALRGKTIHSQKPVSKITSREKLIFAVITNAVLCLLFPVAAPLFLSFFVGIVIRESKINVYIKLIGEEFLYFATFFLGLMLGVLCDASTLLNPDVFKLLILGMLSLLLSGIGGIVGGYVIYFIRKGNFNPVVGIAGVSCVPSTAKVAQKEVQKVTPSAIVIDYALGANICGVITTAILTGIYITLLS